MNSARLHDTVLARTGNTLTVSPEMPYQSLHHFGTGLLSRLEGSQCNAPLLQSVSLVDTPGVLSGEKQRIERSYNFVRVCSPCMRTAAHVGCHSIPALHQLTRVCFATHTSEWHRLVQVCQWFASRADIILLLFDPHKLDISDEFKETIRAMAGNEEKLRVCLNKADGIDQQQLLRVYGALMWSLGKVVKSPEVSRCAAASLPDVPRQSGLTAAAPEQLVFTGLLSS